MLGWLGIVLVVFFVEGFGFVVRFVVYWFENLVFFVGFVVV